MEIERALRVNVRPPTWGKILRPNGKSAKRRTIRFQSYTLGIDGIGKQSSGDG